MGSVRVRRAKADDALVVAALRLQAARAAGAGAEPGFLDRFAAAWDPDEHPTWVAECDGVHVGLLLTQVVRDLPWPGLAPGQSLHVTTLHTVAAGVPVEVEAEVAPALTTAMRDWARGRGLAVLA
ncbi:MAG: GNAT family N-acetyltransferase [Actinomycetota bacterium]|nr:GNAT family N-acetyltransferase [Actinomycetota bacterium]